MHIISVAKALKNVSHIRGTQRMISVKYLFGCKVAKNFRNLFIDASFYKKGLLKISNDSNASTSPSFFEQTYKGS